MNKKMRKEFVQRSCRVCGSWIKTVYNFCCSNHSRNHIKISDNIDNLIKTGLCIRGIVTDNHSVNVHAFSVLIKIFNSGSNYYINHPENSRKIYLFYDTVHLMKNIRNNLLNKKNFVFSEFVYLHSK